MLNRRRFCLNAAATLAAGSRLHALQAEPALNVDAFERARVLRLANGYLDAAPITITASHSPRSPGGPHDFYSEGDYWWPDPKNPGGPYIRRDGLTNPENFTGHREAMIRLSLMVPALAAAWKLTRQRKYAERAAAHQRSVDYAVETERLIASRAKELTRLQDAEGELSRRYMAADRSGKELEGLKQKHPKLLSHIDQPKVQ